MEKTKITHCLVLAGLIAMPSAGVFAAQLTVFPSQSLSLESTNSRIEAQSESITKPNINHISVASVKANTLGNSKSARSIVTAAYVGSGGYAYNGPDVSAQC